MSKPHLVFSLPASLHGILQGQGVRLVKCDPDDPEEISWRGETDQDDAAIEILACQVSQTGRASKRGPATEEEKEWAAAVDAARRADEEKRRVSGTCSGCNQDPCQCWA